MRCVGGDKETMCVVWEKSLIELLMQWFCPLFWIIEDCVVGRLSSLKNSCLIGI
jgi:hypothetical protein